MKKNFKVLNSKINNKIMIKINSEIEFKILLKAFNILEKDKEVEEWTYRPDFEKYWEIDTAWFSDKKLKGNKIIDFSNISFNIIDKDNKYLKEDLEELKKLIKTYNNKKKKLLKP